MADGRFTVYAGDSSRQVGVTGADGAVSLPGATFTLLPKALERDNLVIEVQTFAAAVDGLGGGLSIDQPRRDAYIVTLSYSSRDSLLARDVPNAS